MTTKRTRTKPLPETHRGQGPADQDVGPRLKDLRKAQGKSLQMVAELSGVSIGQVSQIERGLSSPSVSTLVQLCQALGVTIGALFNSRPKLVEPDPKWIVRAESRRILTGSSDSYRKFLLSPDLDGAHQMYQVEFAPLMSSGEKEHRYSGASSAVVIEGQLELRIDGRTVSLQAGDAFAIPAGAKRHYRNPGPDTVKLIWVISDPAKPRQAPAPRAAFPPDLKNM